MPTWLQIIGIITGILGCILGFANLYLRLLDRRPSLSLEADFGSRLEDPLTLTVINSGQVEVTLNRLLLVLHREGEQVERMEMKSHQFFERPDLPRRLRPGDIETFQSVPFLKLQLKKRLKRKETSGRHEGPVVVAPTVEDSAGKHYQAHTVHGSTLMGSSLSK